MQELSVWLPDPSILPGVDAPRPVRGDCHAEDTFVQGWRRDQVHPVPATVGIQTTYVSGDAMVVRRALS